MDVRLVIRTTPGKPLRAAIVMLALLAAAVAAAWGVTRYKAALPVQLSDPLPLGNLPVSISIPQGWAAADVEGSPPGLVAAFAESAGYWQASRELYVYRFTGGAVEPAAFINLLHRGLPRPKQTPEPARIGPLAARQQVIVIRSRDGRGGADLTKEIIRTAVIGPGQYLVLQLVCLGPPTPREYRLMDHVARSIRFDDHALRQPNDLTARSGVALASSAGPWLALAMTDGSDEMVLLPGADGDKSPAFWGLAKLRVSAVGPDVSLADALNAHLASEKLKHTVLAPLFGHGPRRPEGAPTDQPLSGPVEERKVGPLPVWRVRSAEGDIVQMIYLFRPLVGPTTQGETADSSSAVAPSHAVTVFAWTTAAEEPAATAAIERLVGSVRVP